MDHSFTCSYGPVTLEPPYDTFDGRYLLTERANGPPLVNLDGSGGSSDTLEATRHESNVMQHGYWDESELDRKKEARERSEVDVRTALWTTGSWKR
ncbi:hypothetical protein TEQG_05574 [Trichophyton equinum CBS 127.97]|uniref:Uncharacterized protein n=1 Tax=Trichophyton equinum (strain ATCC MYA-4606 / CBS 127.97) TaxID=559882 RepID=F2PXF8_TRIEC|nr:hypothetical protein TEQG_05574 [Trichophyton equinum CBS 127.97]